MLKKESHLELYIRFIILLSKFWGHLQTNSMWMKSFTHMSCKSIRLLETSVFFSKTVSAYLQYGKELFASCSCHTPLTGVSGPHPYPIGHHGIFYIAHDPIPSQLLHFPHLNTSWLTNGRVFNKEWGYNPRLLLSMRKRNIESIHKGGGHKRYDLQYINLES